MEEQRLTAATTGHHDNTDRLLLVADVFVHGIGGSAYDEITDDIVHSLTGCQPPRMPWFQGTLRLPLETQFQNSLNVAPLAELAEVHRTLRDLSFIQNATSSRSRANQKPSEISLQRNDGGLIRVLQRL